MITTKYRNPLNSFTGSLSTSKKKSLSMHVICTQSILPIIQKCLEDVLKHSTRNIEDLVNPKVKQFTIDGKLVMMFTDWIADPISFDSKKLKIEAMGHWKCSGVITPEGEIIDINEILKGKDDV